MNWMKFTKLVLLSIFFDLTINGSKNCHLKKGKKLKKLSLCLKSEPIMYDVNDFYLILATEKN